MMRASINTWGRVKNSNLRRVTLGTCYMGCDEGVYRKKSEIDRVDLKKRASTFGEGQVRFYTEPII